MRSLIALFCAGVAFFSFPGATAAEEIDPGDLTEFFLGKWTVKGQEDTFAEECRLLTKNSYVICEGAIADPDAPHEWLTMMGYSHFENLYNFTEFGGDGSFYHYKGWLRDGVWTFVSHREYENRIVRIEDVIQPTDTGYLATRWISIDGGGWETRFEEEHVRVSE
jgi:hypothetical protein